MPKKLENTIKYPTSLIVRGADALGLEIAKSLLEQGGYVIIIDNDGENSEMLLRELADHKQFSLVDFSALPSLEEDLRRLDYVFYLQHKTSNLTEKISSQEFLQASNYLDSVLDITAKFEAKFLLTTAVKAHQINLGNEDLELNYGTSVRDRHNVYTEGEIQRYCESLVQEYEERVGIDARLIRLGIILGGEVDLDPDSHLLKLMLDAIHGRNLHLPGDGLDSDYYIHSLDAAYGILKSQFSANTRGKIFTLANEEEVSILSVAYKLSEIEPGAKEIQFDPEDNKLPPLKLYKPAPNLTTIGWKPRVTFERALSQTVEYLRRNLKKPKKPSSTRQTGGSAKKRRGILGKVKNFFFVAEKTEPEPVQEQNLQGALARLIAERKSQERMRKGSIVLANSKLKKRMKPVRNKSLPEKLSRAFGGIFTSLKKKFFFLRNITLTDFFFILIAFFAFGALYLLVISPALSLAKNVYFAKSNLEQLSRDMNSLDIESAKINNSIMRTNLIEAQARISDLQFLFNMLSRHNEYLNLQTFISDGIEYSSGMEDMLQAVEPLFKYISALNPQVSYRFSQNNMLSLGQDNGNYEQLIDEIRDNEPLFRIATDRIEKTREDLVVHLESAPSWVQDEFKDEVYALDSHFPELNSIQQIYAYLPVLLGNESNRNILIIVQDNSKYTSGGGTISGFINLELEKGKLKNIQLKQADQFNKKVTFADDKLLSEVNLVSSRDVTRDNIELGDLAVIADDEIFFRSIEQFYELSEGRKIDMTMTIDLKVVERLLAFFPVTYNQLNFTQENLVTNINLLLSESAGSEERNEIIMNITAQVVQQSLNKLKISLKPILNTLSESLLSRNLRFGSDQIELKNFITVLSQSSGNARDLVSFGLNSDQEQVKISKYPVMTVDIDVNVNKDLTTHKTVTISASGNDALENVFYCTPAGSKNFSYTDVDQLLVSNTFSSDKACVLMLKDNDLKYVINYDTLVFENNVGTSYNYNLEMIKSPGIDVNYSIQFSFDSSLAVVPLDSEYTKQGQSFVYTGVISTDKKFSFDIN